MTARGCDGSRAYAKPRNSRSFVGRRTARYRFYDSAGQPLYFGMAVDPPTRWVAHHSAEWWPLVDPGRTKVDWYATRAEAHAAEVAAIRAERPAHNRAHAHYQQRPMGKPVRIPASERYVPFSAERLQAFAELRAASEAFEEGREEQERRRERLADAIVEALKAGGGPSEIERVAPYDRQHIDRIRRKAGIPAKRVATVQRVTKDAANS